MVRGQGKKVNPIILQINNITISKEMGKTTFDLLLFKVKDPVNKYYKMEITVLEQQ